MSPAAPNTLIASDPPPAFPPWMVEADPRLAAQDTNGLYLALRRRRLLYPRGRTWAEWWQRQRGVPPWAVLLAFFGALWTVAVPLYEVMGALVVIPLAVILMAGLHFIAPLFNARENLIDVGHSGRLAPTWFQALDHPQSPDYARAMFLAWSVGARGRDVVEAVYLDVRERDLRAATAATALVGIAAPLGILGVSLTGLLPPDIAPWSLTLVMVVAAAARTLWATIAHARPVGVVANLVRDWQLRMPRELLKLLPSLFLLPSEATSQLRRLMRSLALMGVVVALAVVVIALTVTVDSTTGANAASAMAAVLVLAAPTLVRWNCRHDDACIESLLEQADAPFEFHAGLMVTGDRNDEARALIARYPSKDGDAPAEAASTPDEPPDEGESADASTRSNRPEES